MAMAERGADMREIPGKAGRAVLAKTLKKKDLPERIPLTIGGASKGEVVCGRRCGGE